MELNNHFVIIPAYNEGKTLGEVLQEVKKYNQNIIVVDDGSNDDTYQKVQEAGVLALKHRTNLGKGAALKTGCQYALEQGAERIIVMDADGQHNPAEIPHFVTALERHEIVFGTRTVPQSMPLIMLFGNAILSRTLRWLYGIKIKDTQCGYRAFTALVYPKLQWDASDYYVETEMVVRAGKEKLKYTEIPIQTIYSDKYKGTTVLDGITIMAKMLSWRLFK